MSSPLVIKAIREAAEVLGYARDHIDGEIDVVDGDYGVPRPNRAMQLATRIDEAMTLIDRAMQEAEAVG